MQSSEESLKIKFAELTLTNNISGIFELIFGSSSNLIICFDIVSDLLKSKAANSSEFSNILSVFLTLVDSTGAPLVSLIDEETFAKLDESYKKQKDLIEEVIKSCLNSLEIEDELREYTNFKTFISSFKPNRRETPFTKRLKEVKKGEILAENENPSKETIKAIKKILENAYSDEFDPLEETILEKYENKLQQFVNKNSKPIPDEPLDMRDFMNMSMSIKKKPVIQKTQENQKGLQIWQEEKNEKKINMVSNQEKPKFVHDEKLQKYRRSFILDEKLPDDENLFTEYKDFIFPFDEVNTKTLKKTICGFLNRMGGRIYIGVNDAKKVKGMPLNDKRRDKLKLDVQEILRSFYPDVMNSNLVKYRFLPIKDPNTKKFIKDLYITKLIIRQGDVDKVYSIYKESITVYIRNESQVAILPAEQSYGLIVTRSNDPTEEEIPAIEFEDPEPENTEEIKNEVSKKKSNEKKEDLEVSVMKIMDSKEPFEIKVKFPYSSSLSDIKSIVETIKKELKSYSNIKIPMADDNTHKGHGFITIKGKKKAEDFVQNFSSTQIHEGKLEAWILKK